jgi:spermidine synthase
MTSRRFLPALILLFVGSGCAALIYEIVWLQLLQLVIGASAVSLGVLLGTFMGGMCLGSLLFPRLVSAKAHPLRVYAILELLIGAVGLLELVLVPLVDHQYIHMGATGKTSVFLRAALASICLLPPTILMGATLPAIARWVEATPRGVSWLGFFYGGNIVGAVFGCLLAGFYLLPTFDMQTATVVAAVINAGVAVLGLALSAAAPHTPEGTTAAAADRSRPVPGGWAVYVAIGLSGLTGLGSEVVWTRLLSLMLGATVYTFSIILAVFLFGLGIGSSAGSFIARTSRRPALALAGCQFGLAAGVAWAAYAITKSIPFWPVEPGLSVDPAYTFQLDIARCFWAVFPAALLWGASFPLALAALAGRGKDPGRLVGTVYAANTVGAILGSLLFSMIIVPALGTQGAQRLLILLCAAAALVAVLPLFAGKARADRDDPADDGETSPAPVIACTVAGVAAAACLAVGVSEPNWASVAWGRNSAYEIAGGDGHRYGIYPAMLTTDEYLAVKEAHERGLKSLTLKDNDVVFETAGMAEGSVADHRAWVAARKEKLASALRKNLELTGKATILAYGVNSEVVPNRYCTFIGEGTNVSVAVTQDAWGYRYFHGAGKVQASSNPEDMRLQRMLGHITALTKKDPKDVLVVACGAGVTAGSFVPYESNITIVDIEPMVPRFVTPQFAKENHSVIPDDVASPTAKAAGYKGYDKTKVVIDDGRHFIRTTTQKFDVITSDPIDPWVKGCAALNTVEYYQFCKDHLKPGGVVALWIPLYESSEDTAKSVIATFFKVFPNGIIWSNDIAGQGYDAVLYAKIGEDGSTDKLPKIDIDEMQAYIDAHPAVKASLQSAGFSSGMAADNQAVPGACEAVELLATYGGSAPYMKGWTANTDHLINWDKNLRLQYVAGKWVNQQIAPQIFNGILREYRFPEEMFTGSPERMAALKKFLAATGRRDR